MIRFACPSCNRTLQAPEDRAGKTAKCPGCQQQMQIPQPAEAAPYADYRELPPPGPRMPPEAAAGHPRGDYAAPGSDPEVQVPLSRRRPERRPHNWAWRWCSPSILLLSLFMLPLPFLSVHCEGPGTSVTLVNQSGLQVMAGGYSKDSSIDRFQKRVMAGLPAAVNAPGGFGGALAGPELKVKPAWCVTIIPFLLLAGIATGLAIRPTGLRVPVVGGVVLGALVLLFIQMAVGFPLDREVKDSVDRGLKQQQQMMRQFGGGGFGNPVGMPGGMNPLGGVGAQANAMAAEMIQTRFTPWFWIWLVLILGALGPLVGELIWALTRRERRWQPAYGEQY